MYHALFSDPPPSDVFSQVLTDAIIMAAADRLIKNWSGVSEFSVYLRQQLGNGAPMEVMDLQLQEDADADKRSTCKHSRPKMLTGRQRTIIMQRPIRKYDKENNDYNRYMKKRCDSFSPRIMSMRALDARRTAEACSRECVRYRSRVQGWKPAHTMKDNKIAVVVAAHWKVSAYEILFFFSLGLFG